MKYAGALGLAGWLVVTFLAAAAGGFASANAGDFYTRLALPTWAPPPWLFGPMWTALYLMMGVAAWLVWRRGGFSAARVPLTLYLVQLVFNALWTWLFFSWQRGALAVAEIAILWVLIVATLLMFWRIRRLAGALLVPYLLWVTFATALTWAVWKRNPAVLGA